jgi:hypothetical protein
MTTFSAHFDLGKVQGELDFVDVHLNRDMPLFVDPFAISQMPNRWGIDAHATLVAYFQTVIDRIREGQNDDAHRLLSFLSEPNETRLGLSRGRPQGAGIGARQADDLFRALSQSQAVRTGFITSLEECELMIEGIGRDKISDLTTNVLRGHLAVYTKIQCELHGIPMRRVAAGPFFSIEQRNWVSEYLNLPVADNRAVLLIPKIIARYEPAYDHQFYYRHYALEYLKVENLNANTSLVRTLKSGARRVFKKDLEARYPCTKNFLFRFSQDHPDVLSEYRNHLEAIERRGSTSVVQPEDEPGLAEALQATLGAIPAGPEAATIYHRLMIGILEFLFFPSLLAPRKEVEIHDGRKRIDIVMENAATTGIFSRLDTLRRLPSAYVAFECKNYTREIANPELDQIAGRFSLNRGKIGFVLCRSFENRTLFVERCRDTLRDDRGLVIGLDDRIVSRWLDLVEHGRRHEIDREISNLIDEVYLA